MFLRFDASSVNKRSHCGDHCKLNREPTIFLYSLGCMWQGRAVMLVLGRAAGYICGGQHMY